MGALRKKARGKPRAMVKDLLGLAVRARSRARRGRDFGGNLPAGGNGNSLRQGGLVGEVAVK